MKILFAANTRSSKNSGIAKILNCLAEDLIKKGNTVEVIFSPDVISANLPRKFSELLFGLTLLIKMSRLPRQKGPFDIVALHSLDAWAYVLLRKVFPNLPPCVAVSYGHDEMRWELEKEEDALGLRKLSWFSKFFYYGLVVSRARFAFKRADHVMVTAKTELAYNQKKYGIPENRMTFIPNGVSPEYFAAKSYSQTPSKILYFGGWEWRKGTRYLAQAFEKICSRYPHVRLTVAGVGAGADEVKNAFAEICRDKIHVIANVPHENTPQLYREHDLFVFPSLFESMSLVVPEAMASGLPVVTTRTCGMQDIIIDGVNGYLVPVRDADALAARVMEILDHPDLGQKLGTAAQESAKNLLWDRIGDQVLEMYRKIVSESRSVPR